MRIQNNIMAMNTHRFYTMNNNAVSKSAEKLSSGYRVNRAGDDAAGLAISEKMRAEIRGLSMASKNSQDGISMVQTAEGALTEVHSMLQRMKELAVQASSDSNADQIDRPALQQEFEQLLAEIDDVAKTTTFNDMNLLDGTFQDKHIQIGSRTGNEMDISIGKMSAFALGLSVTDIETDAAEGEGEGEAGTATAGKLTGVTVDSTGAAAGDTIDITAGADTVTFTYDGTNWTAGDQTGNTEFTIEYDGTNVTATAVTAGAAATQPTITAAAGGANTGTAAATVDDTGAAWTAGTDAPAGTGTDDNTAADATANGGINLLSQATASETIDKVYDAINIVSTERAKLGAIQNRLEHKITNLDNTVENVSAAESRIRDVDIAKEMTNFTKNNILSQAATAMLAQANSLPQGVLSLLQ